MFNISKIMKNAWLIYRRNWSGNSRPANEQARRRSFAQALRNSWAWARQEIADEMKSTSERAAERVRELTIELMRLDARPWGMRDRRVADARSSIQSEISTLKQRSS